jgi:hypothetical protein
MGLNVGDIVIIFDELILPSGDKGRGKIFLIFDKEQLLNIDIEYASFLLSRHTEKIGENFPYNKTITDPSSMTKLHKATIVKADTVFKFKDSEFNGKTLGNISIEELTNILILFEDAVEKDDLQPSLVKTGS